MRITAQALLASGLLTLLCHSNAQAAEISFVTGLYKSQESEAETGGTSADTGKKTTIEAGARFSDQLDANLFWFGEGLLSLKSYDKGDLPEAPSDSTSLGLKGGVRYYFSKLSETVSPYANGYGAFKNEQDGEAQGTDIIDREKNGLYYGADFGIRLSLGPAFFVDLETNLFESALFATETEETTPATGAKSSNETKKTELYADTSGAFDSVVVALGMRL
jgi:hypothetical protein